MTTKFLVIPLITISLALVSCGGNSESEINNEGPSGSDSVLVADTVSLSSDDNEVSYNLPSALQIAYVFKKSGAAFVPSLLNDKAIIDLVCKDPTILIQERILINIVHIHLRIYYISDILEFKSNKIRQNIWYEQRDRFYNSTYK